MRISDWSSDVCSSDLVRDTVLSLEEQGFESVLLPVGSDGLIVMDAAQAVIDERTALVAGMLVNNEIGVIQPVDELRNLAAEQGSLFLCDAVQGYGCAPKPYEDR